MIRNTPKNSVVPAMKHDMAKRIIGGKVLTSPPYTPRQKSISGGNLVVGYKHGAKSPQLTDKKDKHFTHGAMGAQGSQTQKPGKEAGGWEISNA